MRPKACFRFSLNSGSVEESAQTEPRKASVWRKDEDLGFRDLKRFSSRNIRLANPRQVFKLSLSVATMFTSIFGDYYLQSACQSERLCSTYW